MYVYMYMYIYVYVYIRICICICTCICICISIYMYMYVCDIISSIILLFQLHVNSLIINSIRFTNGYCDVYLIKYHERMLPNIY